jgi:hypothetical protein
VVGYLSFFWIRLREMQSEWAMELTFLEAQMASTVLLENPIKENRELASILGSSIGTAPKASRINK